MLTDGKITICHVRLSVVARLLLLVLLFAGTAHADAPTPLRRASVQLIPALAEAVIEPPLTRKLDVQRCVGRQNHATWNNPFSTLPSPLRSRHVRLTGAIGPARIAFHDAFMIEPGHTLRWDIVPEVRPRLEFVWRTLSCGGRVPDLEYVVTVEGPDGTWTHVAPLLAPPAAKEGGRRYSRMQEVVVDLPIDPHVPVRLSLLFRPRGGASSRAKANANDGGDEDDGGRRERGALIALGEPVVTGVPDPDVGVLPRSVEQTVATAPAMGRDINVLWIVIDAVRRDALGPGRIFEGDDVTPNLDAVFARGTSFTHAYALANQTRTSTVAMLASTAPSIGGFHSHTWGFTTGRLDGFYRSDPPLVTRILERNGWRVGHFGHNLFVFAGESIGVDHGFPYSVDFKSIPSDAIDASAFAQAFFEENRDRRWALMLNYTAPHTPYRPPEEWAEKARELPGPERLGGLLPRNYVGELMWVDHNLGPVFKRLDELGLTERTLVIVTADHGEVMQLSHDCFSALVGQPCGFNHSLTVYDDELRVPLVFALPGVVAPGHVVETPISHADLAPTILDMLGLPQESRQMGRSLRPAFERRPVEQQPIVADGRLASALVQDTWKLIVHSRDDDVSPRARAIPDVDPSPLQELFDLAADPNETRNLAAARKDQVEVMLGELRAVRRAMRAAFLGNTEPMVAAAPNGDAPANAAPTAPVPAGAIVATMALRIEGGPDGAELSYAVRPFEGEGQGGAVGGRLECTAAGTGCQAAADGGVEGVIVAPAGAYAEVRLGVSAESMAPGRQLQWRFSVRGETWDEDRLRLGYWGLAFFRGKPRPDVRTLVEAARTDALPLVQPRETAVYLTVHADASLDAALALPSVAAPRSTARPPPVQAIPNDDGLAPEEGSYDRRVDQQLGKDMRKVLRELGYTR
jgi:arylsulfatase A-like enzyme